MAITILGTIGVIAAVYLRFASLRAYAKRHNEIINHKNK